MYFAEVLGSQPCHNFPSFILKYIAKVHWGLLHIKNSAGIASNIITISIAVLSQFN